MKKTVALLSAALFFSSFALAQNNKEQDHTASKSAKEQIQTKIEKPSRDFVILALTYDNWAQAPGDVKITGFGRGFSGYLCYDFPISNSHFSFAAGLGISSSNIYFDQQTAVMNTASSKITFQDVDTASAKYFKRSKLNTTYLEAPFELRYFANKDNRNRGFKMAIGMHVGTLLGAHSKTRHSGPGISDIITEKVGTKRYVQGWRFVPVLRIGWGNFSVYGTYSISSLFNDGAGPQVYPYSIGISISGL